jgi:hypothetical protein
VPDAAELPASRPERSVLLLGGSVLAVIIVAVVAALAFGSGSPRAYPPESPAGVLQAYLAALRSGDDAALSTFLTRRALAQMTTGGSLPNGSYCGAVQERRVRLRDVTEHGERATLKLEVEQYGGSLLDVSRDTYEREVELAREDGVWKVDEAWLCL